MSLDKLAAFLGFRKNIPPSAAHFPPDERAYYGRQGEGILSSGK